MLDYNDEQFENYLKSFRPCEPEPLPVRAKKRAASSRVALAFAAVSSLTVAALLLIALSHRHERVADNARSKFADDKSRIEISMPALTRLAIDDHGAFTELITKKAESQLPAMTGEQSALRVLAKE